MLTRSRTAVLPTAALFRQQGVVLIIALIVLVAMTLAGLGLMRSVYSNNMIAGNLAFQDSTVHSADAGVEDAINYLQTAGATILKDNQSEHGYAANGACADINNCDTTPQAGVSWDSFWNSKLAGHAYTVPLGSGSDKADVAGNVVSYVIDRLCFGTGLPGSQTSCLSSPVVTAANGNEEEANVVQLNSTAVVYYRITVRVAGPRSTTSYVQAFVSM